MDIVSKLPEQSFIDSIGPAIRWTDRMVTLVARIAILHRGS